MATTIQVVVAGLLLLAWVAVLGRPADVGEPGSGDQDRASTGSGLPPRPDANAAAERLARLELPAFIRRRDRVPLTQRRRQRLLATMFAAFASFFLAIAFRGTFVTLFVLMLLALTVHVAIAAWVGGRIVAQQRQARLEAAKRAARAQARANAALFRTGPVIGAGRAGDLVSEPDGHQQRDRAPTGSGSEATDRGQRGSASSRRARGDDGAGSDDPFSRAAEIASALEASDASGLIRPEDLVSDLIDQAWAEPEPDPAPEAEAEPLFTRPSSQFRNRFRRKKRNKGQAKPIHIESQVDDEYQTAVNQR